MAQHQAGPRRHKYFSTYPLGFLGYPPQPGLIRHPVSVPLNTPTSMVSPRTSASSITVEKSRDTTSNNSLTSVPSVYPEIHRSDAPLSSTVSQSVNTQTNGQNSISPSVGSGLPPHPDGGVTQNVVPPSPAAHSTPPLNSCTAVGSSLQYNQPGYPLLAVASGGIFAHYPGLVPPHNHPHSASLSNNFLSHNMPPRFPIPTMGNSIPPELMYTNQYPVLGSNTPSNPSNCGPNSFHQLPTASTIQCHSMSYNPHFPNDISLPSGSVSKKSFTCYNCGQGGHRGTDCTEASIEEMTKNTKVSS